MKSAEREKKMGNSAHIESFWFKLMRHPLFKSGFYFKKVCEQTLRFILCNIYPFGSFKNKIALLFLLLLPVFHHAEARKKTEIIDIYDTQDGLPSNLINDITQDRFGYVWIGTSMGISRFDGKNFITISSKDSPEFFEDNMVDSFLEKDGYIYLISQTNGIIRLNPATLSTKRITREGVSSIDFYNHSLLVLFADNRLLFIDKDFNRVWRKFNHDKSGRAIIQENGVFISFLNEQPQRLNKKTLITDFIYKTKIMETAGGFFRLNKQKVLFHTGKKLFELSIDSSSPSENINNPAYEITYFNNQNKKSICYIANYNKPHFIQDDSLFSVEFEELKNMQLRLIFQTDQNSSLIGTNQGVVHIRRFPSLISQIDDSPFYSYPDMRIRRKILEKDNGGLVIMGYPNILVDDKTLKNLFINDAVKIHDRYYMGTNGSGCGK